MKVNEIRQLSDADRQKTLVELLREQFVLRMKLGSGETVKSHRFKQIRKDVARIKTVIGENQAKEGAQ